MKHIIYDETPSCRRECPHGRYFGGKNRYWSKDKEGAFKFSTKEDAEAAIAMFHVFHVFCSDEGPIFLTILPAE